MARDGVVHPDCLNASNPFHICAEYCPRGPSPRSNIPDDKEIIVPNGVGIKENGVKMEEGRRRSVDPLCVNSSNPFHQCADYCVRQSHDGKSPVKGPKIMENTQKPLPRSNMPANKEILVLNGVGGNENDEKAEEGRRRRSVDPSCVNASNPFHQCADYCVRRSHDEKSSLKGSKFGGTKEKVVIAENRKVNPSCPNASNPFHQCAEYCSKRSVGVDQHKRSNAGESTSKRGLIVAQKKDVNPGCVNASNPFHKCTEHCSQTRKN